jgi:hypothetical protein
MGKRIRKAKVIFLTNAQEHDAFVYDETETTYEVLLASCEELSVLFFEKSTLTEVGGQYLLFILPESL